MTEKRFIVVDDGFIKYIEDTTLTEDKHEGHINDTYELCEELNRLYEENKELKEENKELHRLNHEEVESWSDEKKQMIAEFSNLMFGDKINDKKQKNNWKNEH